MGDTAGRPQLRAQGRQARSAAGTAWQALRAAVAHLPRPHLTPRRPVPAPDGRTVTWVLSGGAALGAAQVGMMRELLSAGHVPDALVGTSVGALNAAWIAQSPTLRRVDELEELWHQMSAHPPLTLGGVRVIGRMLRRRDHVLDPGPLMRIIRAGVGDSDLADLAVPCQVITTCLDDGQRVAHSSGPAAAILAASTALPGLLPPVRLADGSWHVDGGVTDLVPVDVALAAQPSRVFVLDVAGGPARRVRSGAQAVDVLMAGFAISLRAQAAAIARAWADPRVTVISIDAHPLSRVGLRDFSHTAGLVDAGAQAALAALAASASDASGR